MGMVTLGIGDLAADSGPGKFIQTMALGSCLAIVLHDFRSRSGGMAHVALPDSALDPGKARALPGYFADSAVARLLDLMATAAGPAARIQPVVKLVGGANMVDTRNAFNIGVRNLAAARRALESHGLGVYMEDAGGNYSRNVSLDIQTGNVRVWSPGIGSWSL